MALRLRRDVQKSSYYVWFLGAEEAKGLRGSRVITTALTYLVDQANRIQEPIKVTLQVSHKGIKIIQGSSKHFIPHSAITSSIQRDDIVACVLLLYNPVTKCPLHVHAYRCDSGSTAQALNQQLQTLINRLENQKRFEELETRLGLLPPQLSNKSGMGAYECNEQPQQSLQNGLKSSQQPYYHHQDSGRKSSELMPPKRVGSSMGGSDTGNSTHESECSDENNSGSSPIISTRSTQMHNAGTSNHHHPRNYYQPTSAINNVHHPTTNNTNVNANTELFDSLAAELRAKLRGDGPPLLLPPRDYDTVHRSKGNLTAIELRRCRNALIVGNGGPKTSAAATTTAQSVAAAAAAAAIKGNNQSNSSANVNAGNTPNELGVVGGSTGNSGGGKLISSRGSSGIGSDLAPSPERHETNSSSDDEHWTNEADNSVIALKPSQVAVNTAAQHPYHHLAQRHSSPTSHHITPVTMITRKCAPQPPEDNYLRDLPQKPYPGLANGFEKENTKEKDNDSALLFNKKTSINNNNNNTSSNNKWSREDEIKPIIVRPIDYDAKFNHILQSEQNAYQYAQETERPLNKSKNLLKKKTLSAPITTTTMQNNTNYNGKMSSSKKNLQNMGDSYDEGTAIQQQHSSYFVKNKSKMNINSNDPLSSEDGKNYDMNNHHHIVQYLNGKLGSGSGNGQHHSSNKSTSNKSSNKHLNYMGDVNATNKKYNSKHRYIDPADLPFEIATAAAAAVAAAASASSSCTAATTTHGNTAPSTVVNGGGSNNLNIGRNKYAAIHKTPQNYATERDPLISLNEYEVNHNNNNNNKQSATVATAKATRTQSSINSNGGSSSVLELSSYPPPPPPHSTSYSQHYPYHHSSFESIGGRGNHQDNYPTNHHSSGRQQQQQQQQHQQHQTHQGQERNPYREEESLPYIESMEKMMKSSALRFRPLQNDLILTSNSTAATTVAAAATAAINSNHDLKATKSSSSSSSKAYEKNDIGGGYEFTYKYGNNKTMDSNRHLPSGLTSASSSSNLLSSSNRSLTPHKDYTVDGGGGCYMQHPDEGNHRALHRGGGGGGGSRHNHHSRNWSDEDHMYDSPPPSPPQLSSSVNSHHHDDIGIMSGSPLRRSRSRNDQWIDPTGSMLDSSDRLREKIPSSSEDGNYLPQDSRCPVGGGSAIGSNHKQYSKALREKSRERLVENKIGRDRSRGHCGRREYHSPDLEGNPDDSQEEEQNENLHHLQHRHNHHLSQKQQYNIRTGRMGGVCEEKVNFGGHGGGHKAVIPQMTKGYRHSYAEPAAFPRSAGRVGLAAVNPY